MKKQSLDFLQALLDAPGPSGYEHLPAQVWRKEAASFADSVDRDVLGNSYARLAKEGRPVVVIEGHIDEIGLLITHIDEQGFLWFGEVGGWDAVVLIGQRVIVSTDNGPVSGVIGRKAAHLFTKEEEAKAIDVKDLWIDIGATSRQDALPRVAIGDPVVIDAGFRQITDDLIVSRSLDNRVGTWVALEALRLLAAERPDFDLYAIAASQEEISFAGAYTSTFRLQPAVAIVIDVTHATDYPGADKKRNDEVKLGGGPVLARGASLNPAAFREMSKAAERLGMDLPVQASPVHSGTDADAMIRTAAGTATALVSIPNRYMHSPNEMISLADLEAAAALIAEFVRGLPQEIDFRP